MVRRHTTRIGKRNTVTIPAAMLRDLGLKPGDPVVVEEKDGRINLESVWAQIERARGIAWKDGTPVLTDEELEEAIREASEQAATERYLRSLPPR